MNWYFDRYQYKLEFDLPYVHYFRNVRTVEQYERQLYRLGDLNMISLHQVIYRQTSESFDLDASAAIIKFVRWRSKNDELDQGKSTRYFIRTQVDKLAVYTGDLGAIQSLVDLYTEDDLLARQVRYLYSEKTPGFDKTAIYRVDPKNKFRIYLKSRRYSIPERKELYEFLIDKKIKLTWTMQHWLVDEPTPSWNSNYRSWAFSSHYFDFDDETLITMLYLKFNAVVGKVCTIQKKINT